MGVSASCKPRRSVATELSDLIKSRSTKFDILKVLLKKTLYMGLELSRLICWGDHCDNTDATGCRLSRRFMIVEEVCVPSTELGESPYWCSITDSLFYVDITAKLICQYCPASKAFQSMKMVSAVGFAVPTQKTKRCEIILFVGLEDRIVEVNFTTKEVLRTVTILPDDIISESRFNDGKCDCNGRLYAGYMNKKWRDGIHGNVYQLVRSIKEPGSTDLMHLEPMLQLNEIILPNGLIWSKDSYVFYIDSGKNTIDRYVKTLSEQNRERKDSSSGSNTSSYLKKMSTIFKLNDDDIQSGFMLDGMTIDNDGKIWVSIFPTISQKLVIKCHVISHHLVTFCLKI